MFIINVSHIPHYLRTDRFQTLPLLSLRRVHTDPLIPALPVDLPLQSHTPTATPSLLFTHNLAPHASFARLPPQYSSADKQAPYLFSTVWSLIKPWLDEATVRKIHILGRGYKTELQQYIAPENLPVDLGGKCRCERDGGCSLSNAGPWTTPAPAAQV